MFGKISASFGQADFWQLIMSTKGNPNNPHVKDRFSCPKEFNFATKIICVQLALLQSIKKYHRNPISKFMILADKSSHNLVPMVSEY